MERTRAVAYFRMSEDRQEASIPQQKAWAEKAAPAAGLDVVRSFQDEGIPGDEIARRVGLLSLLEFCEREAKAGRPLAAVLVWDQDRFSRANSFTTAALLDRLMACGVTRMVTNSQSFDFTDDKQRVFYNLSQDLGKRAYSQSISASVSRTRKEKAALGVWTGSRPPYGYVVGGDGHLALGDAAEVETVRWIYERYLTSEIGVKRLAAELQRAGRPLPGRKNRHGWTDDFVHQILSNAAYKGTLLYNVTTAGKYHRLAGGRVVPHHPARRPKGGVKVTRSDPADVVTCEGAHPAVIEAAAWEAVQRKLMARASVRGGPNKSHVYPLSGLLYCSECGSVMHGVTVVKSGTGGRLTWKKYLCSRYMRQGKGACHHNAVLESALLDKMADVLHRYFSDDASIADTRRRMEKQRRAKAKETVAVAARLRKRLGTLGGQIDRAAKNLALARNEAEFRRVSAAIAGWEKEQAAAAAELEGIERAAEAEGRRAGQVEDTLRQMAELPAMLREAPPEKVSRVARAMIERVEMAFAHEVLPSGRVRSVCTGGDIHMKDDFGLSATMPFELRCPPGPSSATETPTEWTPTDGVVRSHYRH